MGTGIVLLEAPPARSKGLKDAIEEAAVHHGAMGFVRIAEDLMRLPPASAILEAALPSSLAPASSGPESIVGNDDMAGLVILAELPNQAFWSWSVFASAFLAALAKKERLMPPSLILLLQPGSPELAPGVRIFRFEGEIGREDAILAHAGARRARRGQSPMERLLSLELVIELAGWDLGMIRDLATLDLKTLLDPMAWADGRYVNQGAAPSWAEGSFDVFEERPFPSLPSLLATGDSSEIEGRIWRAQVRAIFPWLEDWRQVALEAFKVRFHLPLRSYDDEIIRDPASLDWGQMQYALRGRVNQREMDLLEIMKKVRNRLAHRETVGYGDLAEADRLARAFLESPT